MKRIISLAWLIAVGAAALSCFCAWFVMGDFDVWHWVPQARALMLIATAVLWVVGMMVLADYLPKDGPR